VEKQLNEEPAEETDSGNPGPAPPAAAAAKKADTGAKPVVPKPKSNQPANRKPKGR
jgi:hypothetical protein